MPVGWKILNRFSLQIFCWRILSKNVYEFQILQFQVSATNNNLSVFVTEITLLNLAMSAPRCIELHQYIFRFIKHNMSKIENLQEATWIMSLRSKYEY